MKAIAGNIKTMAGRIFYKGEEITSISQPQRVKKGITLIPEGRQIYFGMPIEDNLLMGAYTRNDKTRSAKIWKRSIGFSRFCGSAAGTRRGTLSGGEAQMCAIGRG